MMRVYVYCCIRIERLFRKKYILLYVSRDIRIHSYRTMYVLMKVYARCICLYE